MVVLITGLSYYYYASLQEEAGSGFPGALLSVSDQNVDATTATTTTSSSQKKAHEDEVLNSRYTDTKESGVNGIEPGVNATEPGNLHATIATRSPSS
jgi:hypothetical protein